MVSSENLSTLLPSNNVQEVPVGLCCQAAVAFVREASLATTAEL